MERQNTSEDWIEGVEYDGMSAGWNAQSATREERSGRRLKIERRSHTVLRRTDGNERLGRTMASAGALKRASAGIAGRSRCV